MTPDTGHGAQGWIDCEIEKEKGSEMTDDLVERLVSLADCDARAGEPLGKCMREAADRIEELEDKLDWVIVERDETFALMLDRAQTAEAKLAKAVDMLVLSLDAINGVVDSNDAFDDIHTTLAELTGGKDE